MELLEKLRQEIPYLPKKLAVCARYALDNPERIALHSMRASAGAAGVTSTTMLRLARHVGFESFEDFKAGFQSKFVARGFGLRADALLQETHDGPPAHRILASVEQNIRAARNGLDTEQVSAAARLLRQAPACYLVGSGSMFWLASIMNNTGGMVLRNLRLVGAEYAVAAEAMIGLTRDDVVIGFGVNPYARRTVDALQFARAQGAHTLAITDVPSSPVAEEAEFAFCAGTASPHYYPSVAPLMALVEALLATLVGEGTEADLMRIQHVENSRRSSESYIDHRL